MPMQLKSDEIEADLASHDVTAPQDEGVPPPPALPHRVSVPLRVPG
jgi:hypothetical protein